MTRGPRTVTGTQCTAQTIERIPGRVDMRCANHTRHPSGLCWRHRPTTRDCDNDDEWSRYFSPVQARG